MMLPLRGALSPLGRANGRNVSSLLTGLVSWWKLDESSGGSSPVTRNDSHSSNHLTDNNTVPSGTGKVGTAASITGASSERLSITHNATLAPGAALSVSFWLNPTMTTQSGIVGKDVWSTNRGWQIEMSSTASMDLKFYTAIAASTSDATNGRTAGSVISTGAWHHVVFVYDGGQSGNSNRLKCWINGSSVSLTYTGTIPSSLPSSTADLVIGGWVSLSRYYTGLVDEVALWSRALTSDEVATLYAGGSGITYPG